MAKRNSKRKGFSLGIGSVFIVIIIVIVGAATWGIVKKSNNTSVDTLQLDSGTHPHVFSYGPDNKTVWLGTHTGMYALKDNTWQRTLEPLRSNDIMGLEIDPVNPNNIFVSGHGFVKRSVDGGATWQVIENGLPNQAKPDEPDAHYLTMDPDNPAHLFMMLAGPGDNLYETKDGGETWTKATPLPAGAYAISMLPNAPSSILAATETGLIRYDLDNGVQEKQITNEPAYQLSTLSNGDVIIMTESGFLKTADFRTWTPIKVELNGQMPLGMKASKQDSKRLLIVTDNYTVYESADGGKSWSTSK